MSNRWTLKTSCLLWYWHEYCGYSYTTVSDILTREGFPVTRSAVAGKHQRLKAGGFYIKDWDLIREYLK